MNYSHILFDFNIVRACLIKKNKKKLNNFFN